MRVVYSILVILGTPFVFLYLALRGFREPSYRRRWSERFGFNQQLGEPNGILIHAASVGEVNASRELVIALSKTYPECPLTISTLTPTGSAQVRKVLGDKVSSCFIPIDIPWFVGRFIKRLQPALIIVIETEIWPNLYRCAQRHQIPLMMANARLSERSVRRYQIASEFIASVLQTVAWIGAQSADDQRRLVECGANPDTLRMTGNLKFDLDVGAELKQENLALRTQWGRSRFVLVAGSTHEDDENVIIPAFQRLLQDFPDALLILVPRHPERFERSAQTARDAGFETALYSQGKACSTQTQVFVIDTIGELMTYYACGDIAFVGGSIGDQGGHNALEPAALGLPVLLGPNMDNAREIADQLLSCNAARCVANPQEFYSTTKLILSDLNLRQEMGQAGRSLVEKNRGALDATLRAVRGIFREPGIG